MKALFISYNQAYGEEIVELLEEFGQRGFTRWDEVAGRGTLDGEPHMGNHAWPTLNCAILTVVHDTLAPELMNALSKKDEEFKDLGLRAYLLPVEQTL